MELIATFEYDGRVSMESTLAEPVWPPEKWRSGGVSHLPDRESELASQGISTSRMVSSDFRCTR